MIITEIKTQNSIYTLIEREEGTFLIGGKVEEITGAKEVQVLMPEMAKHTIKVGYKGVFMTPITKGTEHLFITTSRIDAVNTPEVKKPKAQEELGEELCNYCSLEESQRGVHCYGGEPVMCWESGDCAKAYEAYIEQFDEEAIDNV